MVATEHPGRGEHPVPTARRRSLDLTAGSVYGLIVASAVLVAADESQGDLEVLAAAVVTILGVWIAHVFSEVLSGPAGQPPIHPLRAAVGHAVADSLGLLLAAVPPLAILLLGGIRVLDEDVAYYAALAVTLALLSGMGWVAFGRRGGGWRVRLAGAVGTAVVGAVVIVVKASLH